MAGGVRGPGEPRPTYNKVKTLHYGTCCCSLTLRFIDQQHELQREFDLYLILIKKLFHSHDIVMLYNKRDTHTNYLHLML